MIRFLDLKKTNATYEPALSEAALRVVKSGCYVLGEEVRRFEDEYAAYIGAKHCIGVANGLDALKLLFRAHIETGALNEGDEVLVPANTYIATILAISENRLTPVPVEPDITSFTMDPELIEERITTKTRAILLVHLYGRNAMTDEIRRIVKDHGLLLFEDNAQAHGACWHGKKTGSLGNAGAHSFYPSKNLGALGDGGAITTDSDAIATILRAIANYGSTKKHYFSYKGINSRLDEIQAAMLRLKLRRLDDDNVQRKSIAQCYGETIKNSFVMLPVPVTHDPSGHVWHLYVIRTPRRDDLVKFLDKHDIQTSVHYPVPPHRQKAYREWQSRSYPITEKIHRQVVSLPMGIHLEAGDIHTIADTLNQFQ
jgi:dTDP-4-amino-4,6-dideoxygalactose transaminase